MQSIYQWYQIRLGFQIQRDQEKATEYELGDWWAARHRKTAEPTQPICFYKRQDWGHGWAIDASRDVHQHQPNIWSWKPLRQINNKTSKLFENTQGYLRTICRSQSTFSRPWKHGWNPNIGWDSLKVIVLLNFEE